MELVSSSLVELCICPEYYCNGYTTIVRYRNNNFEEIKRIFVWTCMVFWFHRRVVIWLFVIFNKLVRSNFTLIKILIPLFYIVLWFIFIFILFAFIFFYTRHYSFWLLPFALVSDFKHLLWSFLFFNSKYTSLTVGGDELVPTIPAISTFQATM